MSEPMGALSMDPSDQTEANQAGSITAGQLLRQLRESMGVHIDVLAGTLKVPVNKLQALEADRYDAFPDAVFMRALASGMCRALKADAAAVLALLPQGEPVQLSVDKGLNASFKDPGHRFIKGGTLEKPKSRMLGVTVAGLLVAALAIAFFPQRNESPSAAGGSEAVQARLEVPLATRPTPVASSAALPAQDTGGGVQLAAPESQPSIVQAPVISAAAPAASSAVPSQIYGAAVEATASTKTAEGSGLLLIRARGDSWIQVRAASGGVVLQKILTAGESVSPAGEPPWSVIVGKADVTDVIVRGQSMDLNAIARENVARFEVK